MGLGPSRRRVRWLRPGGAVLTARGVNRFVKPAREIVIPPRVAARAATRYVEDGNGCYVSTYSVASHGYAQIGWREPTPERPRRSVMTLAHRAAWVHMTEVQIPAGMTIDHTCKNRRCVNVAHLRMLSNYENARRTFGRDWPLGQCVNGHDNSQIEWFSGHAQCGPCTRATHRRYDAKRKAA